MPIASRLTSTGTSLVNGEFRSSGILLVNGTFDEVSLPAGAISFNGTSQYLTATSPNLSGTWTVEMWCYWTTGNTQTTIVSFNNGSNSGINLWKNTSNQLVADDGVNGVVAMSTVTPTIGAWNHIAFVRVGTTTSGYVNGVLAGTTTYTPGTTSAVSVGRYNGGTFFYFPGYISNLRVVNGVAVYTSAFTPPQAILPAISGTSLLLNVTDSTNFIRDNSTNNYTITNNGTATFIANGPFNRGSTAITHRQLPDGTLEVYSNFDESTFSNLAATRNTINQLTADTNGLNNFSLFATKQAAQGGEVANIAPPGGYPGNVAYMYITSAVSTIHNIIRTISVTTTFHPLTYSAYMKGEGTIRYMQFIIDNAVSAGIVANFDLLTGAVTTFVNTTGVVLAAAMTNVGDGWWRCSLSGNVGATASRVTMITSDSGTAAWYPNSTFAVGSKVYIWGMQLEYNKIGPSIIYQPVDILGRGYATFARSENSNGDMYLSGIFDEITGAPVVDSSLQLWLDAGQTSSYPGSGATWTDLSGNGRDGILVNTTAISYVASATSQSGTGLTITVTVPAGISNGQLMLMIINSAATVTWTTPAGWNAPYSTQNGRALFWRTASSEPANYVVTQNFSTSADAIIVVYANATFDTSGFAAQTATATVTPVAITVANRNSTAVYAVGASGGASVTWTTPVGYTFRVTENSGTIPESAVWDTGLVEAGSYQAPPTTGTAPVNALGRAYVIALSQATSVFSYFNPTVGGGAITLAGASSQYVTSSFATTAGQAVTYCGWLYSTETTATYRNFVDSGVANPMIWWNTSGQIEFDSAAYTTTTVYRNQWVYVALSKPSGTAAPSYYVNGVLVGTGGTYSVPAVTPTWFNRAAAQTWQGSCSQIQVYNRVLTADEIQTNFNALRGRYGI